MTDRNPPTDRGDQRLVADLLDDEPALLSSLNFGPYVAQGRADGPSLLIGDQSEIALFVSAQASRLDYRMALLAKSGDSVLVRRRVRCFEDYLAEVLGQEDVTYLHGSADDARPVAQQVRTSGKILEMLAYSVQRSSGLILKPYLTTGHSWRLAQSLGEATKCCIHVWGPSPRLAQRVNNKLWFGQLARSILGNQATPPTQAAYGPAAAAGLVSRMSRTCSQIVVKVPDSAGSAGNLRLDTATVRGKSLDDLRNFLLRRIRTFGWQDTYPILVGVWDEDVTCSPSAQIWVPRVQDGPPVVEGIFEQHVRDSAATFVGASPSTLPQVLQDHLSAEALRIAGILQRLGYFGRCSFDAVIFRAADGIGKIHWIECNGRWSGVSIPMTAAAILSGTRPGPAISIVQELHPGRQMQTKALLQRLGDLLFRFGHNKTGVVVMSPPEHDDGTQINLLSMSQTQADCDGILHEAMQRILD
ncbi:hypothetical protein SAMN05444004_108103 [Jannaschia faecimaris]|uniref:Pre ATP-grasp domain-containing protein n=1 Tax=Jannaschia faecimaris TaxID=1244108 RepID=A0A1H3RGV5_9RHOB|nr:hypothetical protein [Jannaschia faecimaris]SDZ24575.1 hypothetical protein SAMN05444004_108103 [Jannaschia faecimaris]